MRSSGLPGRPLLPNVPPLPLPSSPSGGHGGNRGSYGDRPERTTEVSPTLPPRNASRASLPPPRNPTWGRRRAVGTGSGVSASRAGHADLLRSVFRGYRDMEFGQDLILRFHGQLFRHSAAHRAQRGRYKEVPDRPPAYVRGGLESPALRPTEPHLVPREMENLVHWTTTRLGSPHL